MRFGRRGAPLENGDAADQGSLDNSIKLPPQERRILASAYKVSKGLLASRVKDDEVSRRTCFQCSSWKLENLCGHIRHAFDELRKSEKARSNELGIKERQHRLESNEAKRGGVEILSFLRLRVR